MNSQTAKARTPDFHRYDGFPYPIEIFAPDGACLYINQAGLDINHIPDADLVVGKYNLRHDPVCIGIYGQDAIDRIFRGEPSFCLDSPAPARDAAGCGIADGKVYRATIMDIYMLPVWAGGQFLYMICFSLLKNTFKGLPEIVKTLEYMDTHWLEEFDREKLAKMAHLSPNHFSALFRNNVGITPKEYYKQVKIIKLKEKLTDPGLSIAEAFEACGVNYHGRYRQFFKTIVGMLPSQYRDENIRRK